VNSLYIFKMFFQQDTVDNFYMVVNSEPTVLYPDNSNDEFSVSFPHRKDFSINEAWEVAVTSLTIPYWITNPISNRQTNWYKIDVTLDRHEEGTASKVIYLDDGHFPSRCDYIKTLQISQPLFVFMDEADQSISTLDLDDYFVWHLSPSVDRFVLDTSTFFDDYPEGKLRIVFGSIAQKSLQPLRSRNRLTKDIPLDHRVRSAIGKSEHGREGYYYKHKNQILVHSNLTGSLENTENILFHNAELNKATNHTHYGTVNLVPHQLEYHKVTLNNFSHINFKITDCDGDYFNWLLDTPVTLGLHFRKRYYINVYN